MMKSLIYSLSVLLVSFLFCGNSYAQLPQGSVYGDAVKADVKMNYVYSLEEAMKLAKEQNKLIFFNCFVDWALPCHGMNKLVFSDKEFCDYMNKTFINLFMDMNSSEGQEVAKKYNVSTFAHYLILDADGNIVLRIVGGKKLPDFKNEVNLALSPETSLVGSRKIYESGKYTKENLYNYMHALELSDEDSLLKVISEEYMSKLKPEEYADPKNWTVFCRQLKDYHQDTYKYMIEHKPLFVKNIGKRYVDNMIESIFSPDLMKYATGSLAYNKEKLNEINAEMDKAALSDTCISRVLYNVALLRGEKKYQDLIHYLDENGKYLTVYRTNLELSLKLPDMTPQDKALLVDYLNRAVKRTEGTSDAKYLETFAKQVLEDYGIKFEKGSFNDALNLAKKENKLVFMDCYTYWCGPCRMMASSIFTRKDVGDFFNERFVSIKVDMEKGEGVELAKKYGVKAYPTMLILDTEGNIIYKIVGACDAKKLIETVRDHSDPSKGYTVSKAAYESGKRTPEVMANYISAMVAVQEMSPQKADSLVNDYCGKLSDNDLCTTEGWYLLERCILEPQGETFERMMKLHDKLVKAVGDSVVNKKIERLYFPKVIAYYDKKVSKEEVKGILDLLKQGHYPAEYTQTMLAELVDLDGMDAVINFYQTKVKNMKNPQDKLNMDLLLSYFVPQATDAQKETLVKYVEEELSNCDKRAHRGYTNLLSAVKEGGYKD